MKSLHSVVIASAMTTAMLFAQAQNTPNAPSNQPDKATPAIATTPAASSGSSAFTGTIVNATCTQASALPSMNPASYADRGATAPAADSSSAKANAPANKDNKSVYDIQRDIFKRCPGTASVSSYALVTDDGRFLKLDEAGNGQVKNTGGKKMKNMRVSIAGSLDGDTLKVQSLTAAPAQKM